MSAFVKSWRLFRRIRFSPNKVTKKRSCSLDYDGYFGTDIKLVMLDAVGGYKKEGGDGGHEGSRARSTGRSSPAS